MATFNKCEQLPEFLCNAQIDLFGTTDTIKAIIHTDAPTWSSDNDLTDFTQITGTGYTSGGADIQNDSTRSAAVVTMTAVDYVWTAGAADWTSTARYVTIYDDTPTTPLADPAIGGWDYGSTFALGNGETFTLDFGASLMTVTAT